MRTTISFTIEEEQLAAVDALAAKEDRDRSSMLRRIIDVGMPYFSAEPGNVHLAGVLDALRNGDVAVLPADVVADADH